MIRRLLATTMAEADGPHGRGRESTVQEQVRRVTSGAEQAELVIVRGAQPRLAVVDRVIAEWVGWQPRPGGQLAQLLGPAGAGFHRAMTSAAPVEVPEEPFTLLGRDGALVGVAARDVHHDGPRTHVRLVLAGHPSDDAERWLTIVEHLGDGFAVHDGTRVLYANPMVSSVLGVPPETTIAGAGPVGKYLSEEVRQRMRSQLQDLAAFRTDAASCDVTVQRADGGSGHYEVTLARVQWSGRAATAVLFHDTVSRVRNRARRAGRHAVRPAPIAASPARPPGTLDTITPYRDMVDLLGSPERSDHSLVVLDLDRFGLLNARYGTAVGDLLLERIAERVHVTADPADLVVRLGGDRFAIATAAESQSQLQVLAHRLIDAIREPIEIGAEILTVTSSAGAVLRTAGHDPAALVEQADRALREARGSGGRQVRVFAEASIDGWDDATFVEQVVDGLATGQFRVVYQPIVDLVSGSAMDAEALLRWEHPVRGDIPPAQIIPLAERTGVILEIDRWVLETVCADLHRLGTRRFDVSVNVSVTSIRRPDFVASCTATVDRAGIARDRIWLEVTENALVDDDALSQLLAVHDAGFRLSIDDFGTGFSSLQYVSVLPVDAVKIDRSFVGGLAVDSRDNAIVRSVVQLGRDLGIRVIAEGVENAAQAGFLRAMGCPCGQGWMFGRPAAIESIAGTPPGWRTRRAAADSDAAAISTAVAELGLASDEADPVLQRLVMLAGRALDAPIAALALSDADRWWLPARIGTDVDWVPASSVPCATEDEEGVVVAHPVGIDEFDARVRFVACAPVRSREGLRLGRLVVMDHASRDFDADHRRTLQLFADEAASLLDDRRAAHGVLSNHGAGGLTPVLVNLAELVSDVVMVVGRSGTVHYVNSAARTLLGREPEDWIGHSALDVIHPEDVATALDGILDAQRANGRSSRARRLRVSHTDGRWIEMSVNSTTLTGVPGIDGMLVVASDVTAQHRVQQRVSHRRLLMTYALDLLDVGVLACDVSGNVRFVNAAAAHIHGRRLDTFAARSRGFFGDLRVPDGSRTLRPDEVPSRRALRGLPVDGVEVLVAPPGLPPTLVSCRGRQVLDPSGEVIGAVVTITPVVRGQGTQLARYSEGVEPMRSLNAALNADREP